MGLSMDKSLLRQIWSLCVTFLETIINRNISNYQSDSLKKSRFERTFEKPRHLDHVILTLIRTDFTDKSTIGELYFNGTFECYTLEDPVRDKKIYGETAIPKGRYKIDFRWSPKYKRKMPRLLNVKNYIGILIHWGCYPKDTKGCVLVGEIKGKDFIGRSKIAFNRLFERLKGKEVEIIIQ